MLPTPYPNVLILAFMPDSCLVFFIKYTKGNSAHYLYTLLLQFENSLSSLIFLSSTLVSVRLCISIIILPLCFVMHVLRRYFQILLQSITALTIQFVVFVNYLCKPLRFYSCCLPGSSTSNNSLDLLNFFFH